MGMFPTPVFLEYMLIKVWNSVTVGLSIIDFKP